MILFSWRHASGVRCAKSCTFLRRRKYFLKLAIAEFPGAELHNFAAQGSDGIVAGVEACLPVGCPHRAPVARQGDAGGTLGRPASYARRDQVREPQQAVPAHIPAGARWCHGCNSRHGQRSKSGCFVGGRFAAAGAISESPKFKFAGERLRHVSFAVKSGTDSPMSVICWWISGVSTSTTRSGLSPRSAAIFGPTFAAKLSHESRALRASSKNSASAISISTSEPFKRSASSECFRASAFSL